MPPMRGWPVSNPSSRPACLCELRVLVPSSQVARVLHVPTITRRSGLSDGLRSCPPTQPGRFFAADKRARIAVSHSRPTPSFRCTCVTMVIIELILLEPKSNFILSVLLDHLIRPLQERRRDRQTEGLGGLEVDDQLERRRLLHWEVGGLGAAENLVVRTRPHGGRGPKGRLIPFGMSDSRRCRGRSWSGCRPVRGRPFLDATGALRAEWRARVGCACSRCSFRKAGFMSASCAASQNGSLT